MADSPIKKKTDKNETPTQGGLGSPDAISLTDIKDLFQLMRDNEIAELKIEQHGAKVHIVSKGATPPPQPAMVQMMPGVGHMPMMNMAPAAPAAPAPLPAPAADQPAAAAAAPAASEGPAIPPNAKTVTSPMVGTFYRSPSPESPAFVREGDIVNEDTVLCIIEAMKLMNEIKAETKGKILKVLLENGMPVEFNQPLFLIEP